MLSHCDFNLYFPDNQCSSALSNMLIDFKISSFVKGLVKTFAVLSGGVVFY